MHSETKHAAFPVLLAFALTMYLMQYGVLKSEITYLMQALIGL